MHNKFSFFNILLLYIVIMELLAVGGLAYLGTILNQHILKEYTDADDKQKKEKFAFVNPNDYKNDGLKNITKKYQKKVDQIKRLSTIPDKTNVIPSFYNQMPGVGEEYKNQKYPNKRR